MSKWRPIETAPRDGTEILAYANYGPGDQVFGVTLARFNPAVAGGAWTFRKSDSWGTIWAGLDDGVTHWMPLPSPPSTTKEAA